MDCFMKYDTTAFVFHYSSLRFHGVRSAETMKATGERGDNKNNTSQNSLFLRDNSMWVATRTSTGIFLKHLFKRSHSSMSPPEQHPWFISTTLYHHLAQSICTQYVLPPLYLATKPNSTRIPERLWPTLKEISVVMVKPWVMTGSSSVVRPFQQSSSMQRHPDRSTCLYISTEELPASWPAADTNAQT